MDTPTAPQPADLTPSPSIRPSYPRLTSPMPGPSSEPLGAEHDELEHENDLDTMDDGDDGSYVDDARSGDEPSFAPSPSRGSQVSQRKIGVNGGKVGAGSRPRFTDDEDRAMVKFLACAGSGTRTTGDKFWRPLADSLPPGPGGVRRDATACSYRYRRNREMFDRLVVQYLNTAPKADEGVSNNNPTGTSMTIDWRLPTTKKEKIASASYTSKKEATSPSSAFNPRAARPRYSEAEEEEMAYYIVEQRGKTRISPSNEIFWREYATMPERTQQRSSSSYGQKYYTTQKNIDRRVERILREQLGNSGDADAIDPALVDPSVHSSRGSSEDPAGNEDMDVDSRPKLPASQHPSLMSLPPISSSRSVTGPQIRIPRLSGDNMRLKQEPAGPVSLSGLNGNGDMRHIPRPSLLHINSSDASNLPLAGRRASVTGSAAGSSESELISTPLDVHPRRIATVHPESHERGGARREDSIESHLDLAPLPPLRKLSTSEMHSRSTVSPTISNSDRRFTLPNQPSNRIAPQRRAPSLGVATYVRPLLSDSRSVTASPIRQVGPSPFSRYSTGSSVANASHADAAADFDLLAQQTGFTSALVERVFHASGRIASTASFVLTRAKAAADDAALDALASARPSSTPNSPVTSQADGEAAQDELVARTRFDKRNVARIWRAAGGDRARATEVLVRMKEVASDVLLDELAAVHGETHDAPEAMEVDQPEEPTAQSGEALRNESAQQWDESE